jgi:hypothetical protein
LRFGDVQLSSDFVEGAISSKNDTVVRCQVRNEFGKDVIVDTSDLLGEEEVVEKEVIEKEAE